MNTARTFFEGWWCLLTTPWAFWILSVHQDSFQRCCYGKRPQGGSISSRPFFSFSFCAISFWSYIGTELLSNVVCRSLIKLCINAYIFFSGSFPHIQKILKSTEKLESEKRIKMRQEVVEKQKWSHSVVSNSSGPHGLQPTRVLRPWDFPGRNTGVGCHFTSLSFKLAYLIVYKLCLCACLLL